MLAQEKNRLKITPAELKTDIEDHIAFLTEQVTSVKKRLLEHIQTHESLQAQHQLRTSIVGIGESSTARVLLKLAPFNTSARLGSW